LCCVILHDIAHAFDAVRHQIAKNVANGNKNLKPPLLLGGLAPGSSASKALSELSRIGLKVPSNYVASPARSGNGWVFRPPGSSNNDSAYRAMDSNQNPDYSNGYGVQYSSKGSPLNSEGLAPSSREAWHQPFESDDAPSGGFDFVGE